MTRLHPAISLDDVSGPLDRPRRPKARKRGKRRPLAWRRPDPRARAEYPLRSDAQARAEQELRDEAEARAAEDFRRQLRRRALEREPVLEPVSGGVLPGPGDAWGPAVRMGRNLRVQAAVGHRAAVIELKPGLFVVAEIPEQATRPEFGILPFLAPMIVKAAADTITPIVQATQAQRAARQANEAQVRMVAAQPSPSPAPPRMLPGPVATPATAGTVYLPAPNVGWADDALVAEVMGCDCDQRGRR
jgi:hypothetical protein